MKYLGEYAAPSVRDLDSGQTAFFMCYVSKLTCAGPGFDTLAIRYISLDDLI